MTDVEMIKGYAGTSGPNKGMFWEGKTTQEKISAQLAGFSLAEMKQNREKNISKNILVKYSKKNDNFS